jgi:hypothetical protein
MTDTAIPGAITRFCDMLAQVNITEIAETDQHVVFAVRVPIDLGLDNAGLLALCLDDRLGTDLGRWLTARAAAVQS